jgi:hypothetical protein
VSPSPPAVSGQARVFVRRDGSAFPVFQPRRDAYVYDDVTYNVGPSTVAGKDAGHWIRRNGQPLAGPVPQPNGLTFVYQDFAGNNISSPTGNEDNIARVLVTVRTRSSATFTNQAQDDTDSTRIFLRNRCAGGAC